MGIRMANFLEVKASPNQKTLAAFVQLQPRSARHSQLEVALEAAGDYKLCGASGRSGEPEGPAEAVGAGGTCTASGIKWEGDLPVVHAAGVEPLRMGQAGSHPTGDAGGAPCTCYHC
jgi:hypothetical protein